VNYPGELDAAVRRVLAEGSGSRGAATAALARAYRAGQSSSSVDLGAYLATRAPATFAVNRFVQATFPDRNPQSLLDIGTGPGVATWAALEAWPRLQRVVQCEADPLFADMAERLNIESGLQSLQNAMVLRLSEAELPKDTTADMVVASYMLAERPLTEMPAIARRLWARTQQSLILIEPGTPNGFARLRVIRDTLLSDGADIAAPCTHVAACPMVGGDWCHFKVRLPRSREHMHAKGASVPFEDEAFSYLVLTRLPQNSGGGRVLSPPIINKVWATLRICDVTGAHDVSIASRDKDTYKQAKKIVWGDLWSTET
jgi:ribosomal protein RSM22 (predicted rRNA methylase)